MIDLHPQDRGPQGYEHPEVTALPEHPPTCCTQQTITVPPSVNARTAQRHNYTSSAWRRSYARRSAAERSNARIKGPATIDVARGWCRVMGLVPVSLFIACAFVVRNLAVAGRGPPARRPHPKGTGCPVALVSCCTPARPRRVTWGCLRAPDSIAQTASSLLRKISRRDKKVWFRGLEVS